MLKLRKIIRRYTVQTVLLVCVGCFLLVHFFSEPSDYGDNKFKIGVIEESIRSYENQEACKIPDIPLDNPEIMKFYKPSAKLDCGDKEDNWVTCEKSLCTVRKSVVASKGAVTCSFTDLIRKTDYKVIYGKTTRSNMYILKKSDFAKAVCQASNGDRWFGLIIGIRNDSLAIQYKRYAQPMLNVLMIGFDSLSRNAFIRKLPKSYDFLLNQLHSHVLKGYNIVGDGTPQALIPLLTGQTELELPETRKRKRNSNYVDVYPMIWKDYKRYGYVTSFNEDVPNIGTFTYRLNGFKDQPTDHYMRTYYLEMENYLSSFFPYCTGNQPNHQIMLDYTKNFMLKYSSLPKFVFSFHGELSHDSINLIGAADEDILQWLKDLKHSGALNDTILIMMSDHGNRFAEVRNTLQGKQEERLPYFSFTFPSWFRSRYPMQYNNFVANVHSLTTPFDIHETLVDILRIQHLEKPLLNQANHHRSISLFNRIPDTRSCTDAYIEPHWCSCLNWRQINETTSEIVTRLANTVIKTINKFTKPHRSICEKLELDEIHWAMKLAPNDNLLKFKSNKDLDGFMADLTAKTKITNEMYQVKFAVVPGHSIFEASVTHNLLGDTLSVKMTEISRINKYGSQANCVYETLPDLRKYCFCKAQIK